ncbi:hypothetical protein FLAG1_00104 [Fusarium langsethiae]|uniref:Uncharacterized protein n=1 Tax=Fusarium langsethiae TaxID=179993 RepID=A0A0M9F6H0_FUSLA|nr:hypothetical protein FLAG1_00104 [Fusarium langsethiae]GKT97895.1 unnamed protein product [Fusarium langsethiae]GKU10904.1 unnamed protein product [Fusarium langsethiae]
MLRVRRGLGSPAGFASICRPYVRYPRQCTPFRSFATDPNLDNASEPHTDSKSHTENIPKPLDSTSDSLQELVGRAHLKEAQEVKEQEEPASQESISNDANFNEALDVVRRVYGVEQKKKKKTKKSKSQPQTRESNNAEEIIHEDNTLETDSLPGTQQTTVWTSLREKLQQKIFPGSSYTSQSTHDDSVAFVADQDGAVPSSSLNTEQHVEVSEQQLLDELKKKTGSVKKRDDKLKPGIKKLVPKEMVLRPVEKARAKEVPQLAYNLEKVLFNSGPYQLQDRRTQVYNFDPYLGTIMPVEEFDFNALKEYVTSSKDETLTKLSAKHRKKYCGSTSSMTSMLAHFHFLLSDWRKPNFEQLSKSFKVEFETFTMLTRAPVAAFARYKDGVYAIDADKEFDTANILSMLGKSMEKLLTLPKDHFEKYRKSRSHELSDEEKNADEAFHYTTLGDFMMRSQLDARDPRLPGTGVFDLKTRAVVTIRMDVGDYEKGVGYEIDSRLGQWNSFEREYYDMIRAAFLKYSLQVRMGRMDGIFVAFHNTERIFGFQYISLEEMDQAIHGTMNRKVGDEEFKASIGLLNELLNRASKRFPKQSLRLHVETRPLDPAVLYFVAEPVSEEEMKKTQEKGRAAVDRFEKQILGISRDDGQDGEPNLQENIASIEEEERIMKGVPKPAPVDIPERQKSWDEMMAKVDQFVENDAAGLANVREAIEQALEQSGLLAGKSEDERHTYLNELVEALTEDLGDGKEGANEPEDALNTSVVDDLQQATASSFEGSEGSTQIESSSETETLLGQLDEASQGASFDFNLESQNVESVEETVISRVEDNEIVVDDIAGEDDASAQAVDEAAEGSVESATDVVSQDASSLKDLILRVAEGVEINTSNLRTFERILSELVRDQKQLSNEADEDNLASIDDTPATTDDSPKASQSLPAGEATRDQKTHGKSEKEVLGMYVTVRNKVDDQIVKRVECRNLGEVPDWSVEYTITEFPSDRAQKILTQMKGRRRKLMGLDPSERTRQWFRMWNGQLQERTRAGRRARRILTEREEQRGTKVAWNDKPASSKKKKTGKKALPKKTAELKKKKAVSKKTKASKKDDSETD